MFFFIVSAKFPLNFLIPIVHIFSIPPHSVCIFNLKSRPNFALLSQIPVFKYDESYCKRSQCNVYKNAIINSYSFLAHPRYVSSQLEDSIASLSGLICTYLPPFPPLFHCPFCRRKRPPWLPFWLWKCRWDRWALFTWIFELVGV